MISVPARGYEVIERTPTTLRLLAGRYESECPDTVAFSHHAEVAPELLEIELARMPE